MASGKKAGRRSLAQNDFLAPQPPGLVVATDVGTARAYDDAAAVVNFQKNVDSVSYTVTSASPTDTVVKTATGTDSPIIFTGLKSNTQYTFTVVGTGANGLESSMSDPSAPITVTSVPQAISLVNASSPSAGVDRISWTAPANGGKAITNYFYASVEVTPVLPSKTDNTGATTVDIAQEMGSQNYYIVYADNINGRSLASPQSVTVTTTFAFAPFGFSPFSFTPFSFTPFSFTPFSFTPFKFTPFSFTPFKFTPFKAFLFTPFTAFSFAPFRAFGFAPRFGR